MNNSADKKILALGAESAGNFSVFSSGKTFHSKNFGDLLNQKNFDKFKKSVINFLKKENIKPNVIITDLHPLYVTTAWGQELAKKLKADNIQVQHHIAHTFSQIEKGNSKFNSAYSIVLDGTGYGTDKNIWGGECFSISNFKFTTPKQSSKSNNQKSKISNCELERIGHLEYQTLIGGDLAIREPARLLISILEKVSKTKNNKKKANATMLHSTVANDKKNSSRQKDSVYNFVKKYYKKNEFELLWNQLNQNFNCQETSSAGRILDAVSVLLGFAKNERKEKHGATYLLEKSSTKPYRPPLPVIEEEIERGCLKLSTTHLFEYLIKHLPSNVPSNVTPHVTKDPKRLAATAQLYIAQGMHEVIKRYEKRDMRKRSSQISNLRPQVYLSGGLSENKIIKDYFASKNLLINKSPATPCGDAGLSVGQINYYLLKK